MLFKQKLDDIQLKKWLDSRLYLDSLQIKLFSIRLWTNSGQMAGVVIPSFNIGYNVEKEGMGMGMRLRRFFRGLLILHWQIIPKKSPIILFVYIQILSPLLFQR